MPLDWKNLAEKIESLGKSLRAELNSQIRRILRHLFRLEASPATDQRAGWRTTSLDARPELRALLEDGPSLRRETDGVIRRQVPAAAKLPAPDLEQHGEPGDAVWARLDKGGFTAEQVLGDWFPRAADGVAHQAHR